ncbi:MAG TPA: DUF4190 domain-containing protein [Mycobacterium sp.]
MTEQPPGNYPPPPPEGYPPPPPPQGGFPPPPGYGAAPATGTSGLAIASLVCSVVGVFCSGILSIVGIVLGFVALNQIKQTGQGGKGMAQAGIIVGIISLVLGVILAVIYFSST